MTDSKTTDELIADYGEISEALRALSVTRDEITSELQRRLEEDGARVYSHPEYDVQLVPSGAVAWDHSALAQLRELLPPETVAGAFVPAHDETVRVPDRWNMVVARHWGKYGAEVQAILDRARLEPPLRIRIRQKETTNA